MPEYQFTGEIAQAPLGDTLWEPGEKRTVTDAQAAELAANVHWTLVATPAPAPAVPAAVPTPDAVLAAQVETPPTPTPAPQATMPSQAPAPANIQGG